MSTNEVCPRIRQTTKWFLPVLEASCNRPRFDFYKTVCGTHSEIYDKNTFSKCTVLKYAKLFF